jgi:ArsR family transcriptional regulator
VSDIPNVVLSRGFPKRRFVVSTIPDHKERFFLTRNSQASICRHMLTYLPDELERFAEIFKALSNPNRLAIFLRLIARCPPGTSCAFDEEIRECVGDVGQDLGIARTTVSHHVKELRRAGLLRVERRGRNIECWVDGEKVLFLADLLTGRLSSETNGGRGVCEAGVRK